MRLITELGLRKSGQLKAKCPEVAFGLLEAVERIAEMLAHKLDVLFHAVKRRLQLGEPAENRGDVLGEPQPV